MRREKVLPRLSSGVEAVAAVLILGWVSGAPNKELRVSRCPRDSSLVKTRTSTGGSRALWQRIGTIAQGGETSASTLTVCTTKRRVLNRQRY